MEQQSEDDITLNEASTVDARPYRSHKIRACDFCRHRKVRCTINQTGQACRFCVSNGVECTFVEPPRAIPRSSNSRATAMHSTKPISSHHQSSRRSKAARASNILATPPMNKPRAVNFEARTSERAAQNEGGNSTVLPSNSTHIVGPVAADDAQVLEEYMSPHLSVRSEPICNPYNRYSSKSQRPVLYTTITQRREGIPAVVRPGKSQRDILEQILAPHAAEVIEIYFQKINPSFPVIEFDSFMKHYRATDAQLSSTLVCDVYAVSLTFWGSSPALRDSLCPDTSFAWNLAVRALHDDYLSPSLSTVQAALLDLSGRPVTSITGNGITNGRTVALAYSLGLNRDPKGWQISEAEQNLRARLWWCVLVHDQWGSLAHGTPPHIARSHYDVGLPNIRTLRSPKDDGYDPARSCFIALCQLTIILGDVLPLVYDLRTSPVKDALKRLRRIESNLDDWEDSLSESLLQSSSDRESTISGISNLRLGFLIMKMLMCRIALHATTHSLEVDQVARLHHQNQCRKSAEDVVSFVVSLQKHHLEEFWLPYSAYHFASTATLLLRCALETEIDSVADSCLSNVRRMIDRLRRAKEEDGSDLGEICILQCDGILQRMTTNQNVSADSVGNTSFRVGPDIALAEALESQATTACNLGFSGEADPFDLQVPDLWDMFQFDEADFSSATQGI